MADLARYPRVTTINFMIQDKPTRDAGTNFYIKHIAFIAASPIAILTQRPHVTVVIQIDRYTKIVLQGLLNINIRPARKRGRQNGFLGQKSQRTDNPQTD